MREQGCIKLLIEVLRNVGDVGVMLSGYGYKTLSSCLAVREYTAER